MHVYSYDAVPYEYTDNFLEPRVISDKMSRYGDCKVYVGDLGNNASKPELEDAFSYYGPLRNVWVARNPPGFAFVEFEDPRDAEDAVSNHPTKIVNIRIRQ